MLSPAPREQGREADTKRVNCDIGPRSAPSGHERLVVFVRDGKQKAENDGDDDVLPRARAGNAIQRKQHERKQDGEFGGVPTFDDRKPTVPPERDEGSKGRFVCEDSRTDPGEKIVR